MSTPRVHRRRFLQAAAACGLAAPLMPAFASHAQADSGRPRIFTSLKMGMVNISGSLEEKFRVVREIGFDGIELNSPGGVDKAEALAASRAVSLPIHGVVDSTHWKIRHTDPNEATRDKAHDDLQTAIRVSYVVGGSAVLLVPGKGDDGDEAEITQRAIHNIRRALPLAAKLGQHILIENVWNSMFYQHNGPADQTADMLRDFIDAFKSPWVGSYFDIGNHHKYGLPQDWIRTLGKRIVKCDVKDWSRERNNWAAIGEGTIDWPAVGQALRDIGFNGWVTAEVGGGDHKRLQQIHQRMVKCFDLA